MNYKDFIDIRPGKPFGKQNLKGTMITVEEVLSNYAGGKTKAEILNEIKGLNEEKINACLAFAVDTRKNEIITCMQLTSFLMGLSLFFLFASFWFAGYSYIFTFLIGFSLLIIVFVTPIMQKQASAPWALKQWQSIIFWIFILYAIIILGSGYRLLFIPISYCAIVLFYLIATIFWVRKNEVTLKFED